MDKLEILLKEYNTKKLKEIIEQQSSSYSPTFIDYAKDELIRRGENFAFNEEFEKDIKEWNDEDLKNLVELEYQNHHLEYLEIARKEYIKRGLKNNTLEDGEEEPVIKPEIRYPALRIIAGIYNILAWVIGIAALCIIFYSISQNKSMLTAIMYFFIGIISIVGLLAISESIKVIIDIEENTRKYSYHNEN